MPEPGRSSVTLSRISRVPNSPTPPYEIEIRFGIDSNLSSLAANAIILEQMTHPRMLSIFLQIRQVLQVSKYLHEKHGKKVAVISRDWWDRPIYRSQVAKLRKVAHLYTAHKVSHFICVNGMRPW